MRSRTLNIHERFLRHIWNKQYLRREELRTTDGRSLRVLRTGILNPDGGPDVRDAVVEIGHTTYRGDVEIHRTLLDWIRHQHHLDSGYNKVILHVVLERPLVNGSTLVPAGRSIPVLVLEPYLSESIHVLWQRTILDEQLHSRNEIPCAGFNKAVPPGVLVEWIRHLSIERLELKLRRFDERLREFAHVRLHTVHDRFFHSTVWRIEGNADDLLPPLPECLQRDLVRREYWDQLLYEGLMEGLGYSKNREPFIRLSKNVTVREFRTQRIEENDAAIQALLLGAAGLLPRAKEIRGSESRSFVRLLRREWNVRRKSYRSAVLHRADWQFFPTRPGNFPTLRIAAATVLARRILCEDLFRKLIETLKTCGSPSQASKAIRGLFFVDPLPFWKNHYQFDRPAPKPTRPLGPDRIVDLITNTVIPLALLYARIFKDRLVRERTLALFYATVHPSGNSITKLMDAQLLHGAVNLKFVSCQQGVIHLYNYYCLEGRCAECAVGNHVHPDSPEG